MSTTMIKAGEARKWYIIDAEGKPLGRIAVAAAYILRGKHKPLFTPHMDCGDHVIILNADKAVLTGNKLAQKFYYRHTGWIGGLKKVAYKDLMANKPEQAFMLAVKGMLPHNKVGAASLKRLRVYKGTEHNHEAQKPEAWALEIK